MTKKQNIFSDLDLSTIRTKSRSLNQIKQMENGEKEHYAWTSDPSKQPYEHDVIDVIERLSFKKEDKIKYLEIGVNEGYTFDKVQAHVKHGVDPYGGCKNITHTMSSQEFFTYNKYFWKNSYDIIFIDGLHLADIIMQEVFESLKILNPGGYILLHDVCPSRQSSQEVCYEEYKSLLDNKLNLSSDEQSFAEYSEDNPWVGYNGDSWKVMASLRIHSDLTVFSVPSACCGVIAPGVKDFGLKKPPKPENSIYTWEYYEQYMNQILNPINIGEVNKFSVTLCKDK
jgi:hypothetical protein